MMLPVKGLSGEGILDGGADLGEITLAHQRGRDRSRRRAQRFGAHAFVGAHEESLVVAVIEPRDDHRPLDLETKLIAAQRVLRIRRVLVPSARIERIVLEEVEGGPVQRVGAALGDHVDRDAQIRPVLGRRAAGLDLNLFDRIRNRPHAGRGKKVGRGIDAVERQAVLNLPLTGASEAQTDVAVDAREHAGGRGREIPDVTANERQVHDRPLADRLGYDRAVGGQDSCAAASTFTDSVMPPTFSTAFVRTTWLFATSTPDALKVWKPATVTVIS